MPSLTARWTARWLVVLFCLANSTLLLAQSTGGRILGRVADPSAAVLAGVKVAVSPDGKRPPPDEEMDSAIGEENPPARPAIETATAAAEPCPTTMAFEPALKVKPGITSASV